MIVAFHCNIFLGEGEGGLHLIEDGAYILKQNFINIIMHDMEKGYVGAFVRYFLPIVLVILQ